MPFFGQKMAKKRLSSTSALVDGVLEKNHTSELVEAFLEKKCFFSKKQLPCTSELVDGILEKNQTSALG